MKAPLSRALVLTAEVEATGAVVAGAENYEVAIFEVSS